MNKKVFMLAIVMLFTIAIISACGENDSNNNDAEEENSESEKNDNDMNSDDDNEDDNDTNMSGDNDDDSDDSEFADLIDYMEDETEGTADILYENDESQDHEMDGVTATLDGYTLVELNDFHRDYNIPFDEETDGGVVIAKYTVDNDTDDDLAYMPTFNMSYVGAEKDIDNYHELLPEDEQLPEKLSPDDDYELAAGDEITGYYTYPFGADRLDDVLDEGEADVEVPQPQEDIDDYSTALGDEGQFTLSLDDEDSDEGSESDEEDDENKENDDDFYEDKATSENMGDKEMLDSESDVDQTDTLDDVDVTLDGYQFTAFEPNDEEAPRFEDFDDDVVLLTVKFAIDNGGDSEIGKGSMESKLTLDDGSYLLGEGMLLDYSNDDTIEDGDDGDLLQVFVMDKDMYDEDLEENAFEIELGPLRNEDAEDISKGEEVSFELK